MERIYIDTNAFYFFFFRSEKHTEGIKKIFGRIHKGEYAGITSVVALEELAYVSLMKLAEKKYKKHPTQVLRENKNAIAELSKELAEIFDVILSIKNIKIADLNTDAASMIPRVMADYLLLPQDAIHLQTMKQEGCEHILSTDNDFDGIYGITRIRPEDV
jgi:predicted nucleic acid-binding protein